jgi:hypothetical protein
MDVRADGARSPQGHGTRACYTQGCRRPECLEANAVYQRQWRAGHPGYPFGQPYERRRPPYER